MNKELFMCARFKAKDELKAELQTRLIEMVKLTVVEDGCLFYNLHVDRDDDSVFYFLEGWKNEAALSAHEQTAHVKALISDAPKLTIDGIRIEFMHQVPIN
jgi:hypothetical protein